MLLLVAFIPIMLRTVLGQSSCHSVPSTDTFNQIPVRYTPFMPAQIAPVSTIYETIVTIWFNALDCNYLSPVRVDENPAAEGPFTTFVRSSVLHVTRVGCMTETTAATRGVLRGDNQNQLRTIGLEHKIQKRRTAQEAIDQVFQDMPSTLPPDLTSLTVQAYLYLVSVNTAIFAINLIQAGVDLNQTCSQLREPVSQAKLFRTTIDPVQAGDIVCFAANNGLYFPEPVPEVLTYLEDLIYAIQARSSYPADSTAFCWSLTPVNTPWLGFDIEAIGQYLCPGNATTINPTASTPPTPTESVGTSTQNTGATPVPPTGGPFANSTAIAGTGSLGYGTGPTTIGATATPAPYANSTATESTTDISGTAGTPSTFLTSGSGIIAPNATYTTGGTGTALATGELPTTPIPISPAIESVSSTPTRRWRRW